MVNVSWWSDPLNHLVGGERLAGLEVFYDFDWQSVFQHGRATFPHGQSLGSLVKRDCPKGLIPTLFLTKRGDIEQPWIETDDSRLVVVVPIHDYLAHSEPDPAASYYAKRYGPGLTAAKNAEFLATQARVIDAVVRGGLTIEHVELWSSLSAAHLDQLKSLAGPAEPGSTAADPMEVLELLRTFEGVDPQIVDGLGVLLGHPGGEDFDVRLQFLDALIRAVLTDEEAQAAFVRSNRDLLTTIVRSAVDAPDIVALAHRREVLTKFDRLLNDDEFFDAEKASIKGGSEDVWQAFLEKYPWIIGSTLAPQFLHSWSEERLEQTVLGASIGGPGKRPDAVLRTAGAISAVVFAEIKHHRTKLLHSEYRKGCWQVSDEVAGGVAQCQGTVDEAQNFLGKTIDLKTREGHVAGQAFICRPRSLLVLGSLSEFTKDGNIHHAQFESFERFRRGLRDPEILTFDELFERARLTLDLHGAASSGSADS